jgi:hypothetical protein
MLSVGIYYCYAECHYVQYRYAECHGVGGIGHYWGYDTQHNTQHNDTQLNDIQHNDTQYNGRALLC